MHRQRHIIKRQVLEIQVPRPEQARGIHTVISRVHHQRIVPLLERCCSELSSPDRVHHIDSLDIDLGSVDLDHLEEQITAQLNHKLPIALAEAIRLQERQATGRDEDLATTSQLELLTVFVQTGSLPWWADASTPRLLENAVESLIPHAVASLIRLLRDWSRQPRSLERIVHHFDDGLLRHLAALPVPNLTDAIAQAQPALLTVLSAAESTDLTAIRIRNIIWQELLRAAYVDSVPTHEPMLFWKQTLTRVARRTGVTLRKLVSDLHWSITNQATPVDALLRTSIQTLQDTLRDQPRKHIRTSQERSGETEESPEAVTDTLRDHPQDHLQTPADYSIEIGRILDRQEQTGGVIAKLSPILRRVVDLIPAGERRSWWESLRRLTSLTTKQAAGSNEWVTHLEQLFLPVVQHGLMSAAELNSYLENLRSWVDNDASTTAIQRLARALEGAARHRRKDGISKDQSSDLMIDDNDELFIDNAGLVILGPFLSRFFDRLDLLDQKQFKEPTAQHRAVGLLQYLATEDRSPVEYLLPLNKALCGMELSEVFDFGPPVTDAEADECSQLLAAVVEHAPIFKNMSIEGFRGTFLIRKGQLSQRDGAWLLRVERQTYDVVLDRIPWSLNWVRLPWMETPLRVEW